MDRLCGLVLKFLAADPEVRFRFPTLPDFLSSVSGTGSTRPREYNRGEKICSDSDLENRDYRRRVSAALTTRHSSISKRLH
jgi:hypothetical protein